MRGRYDNSANGVDPVYLFLGIARSGAASGRLCTPVPKVMRTRKWIWGVAHTSLLVLSLQVFSGTAFAYSVLTHEEIVDLAWTSGIRPLLLRRFPDLTDDQIREAHSYAYGGSVIQDLGYYPFGNKEFSDLVHYVRTGDFVLELIRQSQNADEYAFALGALSHYTADIDGHPAVNEAVALGYPKLRAKYGSSVRYAQDTSAHLKTEFGFDTLQVSKNRYASDQYHDFIGFRVAKSLLERTFPIVYGLQLNVVLTNEDLAIGSYRFSVSRPIPQMTKVALRLHKKDLMREEPDKAKRAFLYHLSRSDYERQWGKTYTKPDFGTKALSVLLRFLPRIGPFKGMGFNNPTPKTEDLYIKSINATVAQYSIYLDELRAGTLVLPNRNLDDGKPTAAAEYTLADDTYADFLSQLAARHFDGTSPQLRDNILEFYADLAAPIDTRKDQAKWQGVVSNLSELKSITLTAAIDDATP
jgi:Zinc dependent phospholipase C